MHAETQGPPNILSLLKAQALARGERPALLAPGREPLSHAALHEHAQGLAVSLRSLGVTASTRVAVVLPNGPAMASAFLGIAAGAVCAPLNPALQADEFRFHLQDVRADFVLLQREAGAIRQVAHELGTKVIEIDDDPHAPAGLFGIVGMPAGVPAPCAEAIESTAGQAIALVLHTSGTTARPKIVPLSQSNLMASARNIADHLGLSPGDRCLNVMPLFHIHGLVGALLATLAGGGSVVCTPGMDERFFEWVDAFHPSWYTAVPTIHQAVLERAASSPRPASPRRLRFVRSSSAALPPATMRRLQALWQAPVVEAYGMTEAAHQMASNPVGTGMQTPGSVGVATGAQLTILDRAGRALGVDEEGEIAVRGPGVIAAYENDAAANEASFEDGWFRTGDLGRLDGQGRLFLSGRIKEVVNRGGEKVSPREVDEALLEHPDVVQAAAFGVPHASLGEDLAAAVVRREGSRTDESALRAFLFDRLSDFKVPSQIILVPRIPTAPTGKIPRGNLHELLGARMSRTFVAPASATECAIESILREVLEGGPLGLHDNFFAAGGDSLRGARVIARVNRQFGIDLPVIAMFRHPSIAELVAQIASAQAAKAHEEAALKAEIDALSDEEVERLLAEAERDGGRTPAATDHRAERA
jgi:acyl-CoA synthetase (AMP-forming)/AMP-acid ligase II